MEQGGPANAKLPGPVWPALLSRGKTLSDHRSCLVLYLVLRAGRNAACAAYGADNQIGCALVTARDANRILGALRRCPPWIHDLRLDHFLAEDTRGRRRAIELEFATLLSHLGGVGLHLVDHLLLRFATADQYSQRDRTEQTSRFQETRSFAF